MCDPSNVYVIAEAGVNHNGSPELARQLVDAACDAGANAVKFQTFRAAELATVHADKAAYQKVTTGAAESQLAMLKRLELSEAMHEGLIAHAAARGIDFLSTPFDDPSLTLLTDRFGLTTLKLPSGEITNGPLLLAMARRARRLIVSTGMSTLAEVEAALGVAAFGFVAPADALPGAAAFQAAYASATGQQALRERVVLLHCTSEYPAPPGEVNLRAMGTLRQAFGLRVGYSDHTEGIHVSVAAAALGACVIEKHLTLDRTLPGPDHRASLEPAEMTALVHAVRDVELALGSGIKAPMPSELGTRAIARKSLVAARAVAAGEKWDIGNLACKRPGTGISPMAWWDHLGQPALRAHSADEVLR